MAAIVAEDTDQMLQTAVRVRCASMMRRVEQEQELFAVVDAPKAIEKTLKLGEGAFGQVLKLGFISAVHERLRPLCGNTPGFEGAIAIKHCKLTPAGSPQNLQLLVMGRLEAEMMKKVDHENLVKCWGSRVIQTKEGLCRQIAMEFCDGGTLSKYIPMIDADEAQGLGLPHGSSAISKHRLAMLTRNMVSALTYLDQQGVIHRDIKPDNILIKLKKTGVGAAAVAGTDHISGGDDGGGGQDFTPYVKDNKVWESCKLTDFGFARVLAGEAVTRSGLLTPLYAAPEVLASKYKVSRPGEPQIMYTRSCDWWSLGVVLFHACWGALPFPGPYAKSPNHILDSMGCKEFPKMPARANAHLDRCPELLDVMKTILNAEDGLLAPNPKMRLSGKFEAGGQSAKARMANLLRYTDPLVVFESSPYLVCMHDLELRDQAAAHRLDSLHEEAQAERDQNKDELRDYVQHHVHLAEQAMAEMALLRKEVSRLTALNQVQTEEIDRLRAEVLSDVVMVQVQPPSSGIVNSDVDEVAELKVALAISEKNRNLAEAALERDTATSDVLVVGETEKSTMGPSDVVSSDIPVSSGGISSGIDGGKVGGEGASASEWVILVPKTPERDEWVVAAPHQTDVVTATFARDPLTISSKQDGFPAPAIQQQLLAVGPPMAGTWGPFADDVEWQCSDCSADKPRTTARSWWAYTKEEQSKLKSLMRNGDTQLTFERAHTNSDPSASTTSKYVIDVANMTQTNVASGYCRWIRAVAKDLPVLWGVGKTPDGRVYFTDHNTKKTTWTDPRQEVHLPRCANASTAASKEEQEAHLVAMSNQVNAMVRKSVHTWIQGRIIERRNRNVVIVSDLRNPRSEPMIPLSSLSSFTPTAGAVVQTAVKPPFPNAFGCSSVPNWSHAAKSEVGGSMTPTATPATITFSGEGGGCDGELGSIEASSTAKSEVGGSVTPTVTPATITFSGEGGGCDGELGSCEAPSTGEESGLRSELTAEAAVEGSKIDPSESDLMIEVSLYLPEITTLRRLGFEHHDFELVTMLKKYGGSAERVLNSDDPNLWSIA
jgi:serine/threonine protein kinase